MIVRAVAAVAFAVCPVMGAHASDPVQLSVTIKDHRFEPAEIRVPAGTPAILTVENRDATPEEFESLDLSREKIVQGNSSMTVRIDPLDRGEYHFYGEFHEDTAQGVLIAE